MRGKSIFLMVIIAVAVVGAGYLAYSTWSPDEEPDQTEMTLQVVETAHQLAWAIDNDNLEDAKFLLAKLKSLRENLPESLQELSDNMKAIEDDAGSLIQMREKRRLREERRLRQNDSP